ncbi:hypothetical protein [Brevibacillus reuszeri]|uniref:hypothetical protein n=1 Tax=Brevibacillus reuszeri TaxID=54915 RepID=UPI003D1A25EB
MQKKCKNCDRNSYSSGDWYQWICPYCGKDITLLTASPVTRRIIVVRPTIPKRLQLVQPAEEDTA